jgi:polyisoprenyl-teichoic acid--peptidoglycan teichoic acid transferase
MSEPSDHRQRPGNVRGDAPAAGSGQSRAGQSAQLRRLRGRRWPRRILVGANVVVAVLLIAAGSVYGYANWRFAQIKKILIPTIITHAKSELPGAPFTVLVVGSDSRAALAAGQPQFGDKNSVAGQRSDTIILVHVDPKNTRASILSVPRDLWVQIPGKPFKQRINTTFDAGPDLLVQAIEQDLNIPIDHYVEVNFDSFRQVVNAVGGVKEYFPTRARDILAGLTIPNAGCYRLTGDQALAFVRARHYEYYANGRWHSEAESDLARIKRQQNFIRKMVAKAQSTGLTDPIRLNGIVSGITTNLKVDTRFTQSQLLSLAKRFRSINPSNLPSNTLPTTPTVVQGNDVLLLKQPDAQQAIAQFLGQVPTAPATGASGPAPTNVKPTDVKVSVRNGSGRAREASTVATSLRRAGFNVTTFGDADNHGYATTVVRFAPGAQDKAQYLASLVQGGAQLQPDATIYGADVVLITGQSYAGLRASPAPAGTATTTPPTSASATTAPAAAAPTTIYELPGTPLGFVPPAC